MRPSSMLIFSDAKISIILFSVDGWLVQSPTSINLGNDNQQSYANCNGFALPMFMCGSRL